MRRGSSSMRNLCLGSILQPKHESPGPSISVYNLSSFSATFCEYVEKYHTAMRLPSGKKPTSQGTAQAGSDLTLLGERHPCSRQAPSQTPNQCSPPTLILYSLASARCRILGSPVPSRSQKVATRSPCITDFIHGISKHFIDLMYYAPVKVRICTSNSRKAIGFASQVAKYGLSSCGPSSSLQRWPPAVVGYSSGRPRSSSRSRDLQAPAESSNSLQGVDIAPHFYMYIYACGYIVVYGYIYIYCRILTHIFYVSMLETSP